VLGSELIVQYSTVQYRYWGVLDTQGLGSGVAAFELWLPGTGVEVSLVECAGILPDADAGLTSQCSTLHQFISLDHHGMGSV
jgi:hypothetical protein